MATRAEAFKAENERRNQTPKPKRGDRTNPRTDANDKPHANQRAVVKRTKALFFAALLGASGCAVRTTYGPTTYDASRCQWAWVTDGFGGYQQLSCWHTPYATYQPYVVDGAYVRVYPHWYVGPRPRVAPAPTTVVVPPMPPHPPPPHGPPRPAPAPMYGTPVR